MIKPRRFQEVKEIVQSDIINKYRSQNLKQVCLSPNPVLNLDVDLSLKIQSVSCISPELYTKH
jgi:hypothetical protein